MTVKQLLQSVSSSELTEWMAYFDLLNNPQQMQDSKVLSPEEKSNLLKAALSKGVSA